MGVLAVCRYMFELVVWLKHIEKGDKFVQLYIRLQLKRQVDHYSRLVSFAEREIHIYEGLADHEEPEITEMRHRIIVNARERFTNEDEREENIAEGLRPVRDSIQAKLPKELLLYDDPIFYWDPRFHSKKMRKEVLPELNKQKNLNNDSLTKFCQAWESELIEFSSTKWRWKWDVQSRFVGMENDYDFLYAYTSRLLHANPVSINTNKQPLQDGEILMFIKYIHIQFVYVLGFLDSQLESLHTKALNKN